MNEIPKVVFSNSLASADWPETTIATGDLAEAVTRLKQERLRRIPAGARRDAVRAVAGRDRLDRRVPARRASGCPGRGRAALRHAAHHQADQHHGLQPRSCRPRLRGAPVIEPGRQYGAKARPAHRPLVATERSSGGGQSGYGYATKGLARSASGHAIPMATRRSAIVSRGRRSARSPFRTTRSAGRGPPVRPLELWGPPAVTCSWRGVRASTRGVMPPLPPVACSRSSRSWAPGGLPVMDVDTSAPSAPVG